MRSWWREKSLKRGRMSSKRMPGEGKSGNWRKDLWSLILRLESSEEGAGWWEDCREVSEASGRFLGGCEEVESGMMKGKRRRRQEKGR